MTLYERSAPRIATLDILRGIAVMGILAMNIIPFSLPGPAMPSPKVFGGSTGLDLALWALSMIFVEGKFRALFAMLFGASMLLIIERAAAANENPAAIYYRRTIWLFVIGCIHFFVIWSGDILMLYAMCGMVAYLFRKCTVVTLIKWAAVFVILQLIMSTVSASDIFLAAMQATASGASSEAIQHWHELQGTFGPLSANDLAKSLARRNEDYVSIISYRFEYWSWPLTLFKNSGGETLGNMLIGIAAFKSGFLTGDWAVEKYRRWCIACYAITIPPSIALVTASIAWDFDPRFVNGHNIASSLIRPVMAIGLTALLILLMRNGGAFMDRFSAAGRMALTNYIGANVVMTLLFYGSGFGLYGQLSRSQSYLPVIAMWALMLLWSKPWIERYRYGPLEWLWRSLARWRLQPMRRIGSLSPLPAE